jgi:hypothetical protein
LGVKLPFSAWHGPIARNPLSLFYKFVLRDRLGPKPHTSIGVMARHIQDNDNRGDPVGEGALFHHFVRM